MKFLQNIWHDLKEIKSSRKELREFGIVMAVFFGILTVLLWWKRKNFLPILSLSAFFTIFGFFIPMALKPLQKIWMGFAVIIGWFMTRLILGVLFFLVVTPLSLVSRLTGKKYLNLKFRTSEPSYWIPRSSETIPKERYEKQY